MKIILIPDSFKGTMSSSEVIVIMKNNLDKGYEIVEVPIADGGEGTLDLFMLNTEARKYNCLVNNPLMEKINSSFGIIGSTAIIEMAKASGITKLKKHQFNPLVTTTYGTGELILNALDFDVDKIIIGIGGSATNDGGMGMASALGVKFYDKYNNLLNHGGKYLNDIDYFDLSGLDKRLKNVTIEVMCDVNNLFTGPDGATFVYGVQKGGNKNDLKTLEEGMKNLENIILKGLNIDLSKIPGSGAAGGLGGAIVSFLNGRLKSGIDTILDIVEFDKKLIDTDFVITGEGKLDVQSFSGKVVSGLINYTKESETKLIVVAGYTDIKEAKNIDLIISTTSKNDREIEKNCKSNLEKAMIVIAEFIEKSVE